MKILISVLFVFGFGVSGIVKVSAGVGCHTLLTDSVSGHFLISEAQDLSAMSCWINNGFATHVSAKYDLVNDLDMTDVYWLPIGSAFNPFMGVFNGLGHTIAHLTITTLVSNNFGPDLMEINQGGLFGLVSGGSISNLTIQDPTMTVSASVVADTQINMNRMSVMGIVVAMLGVDSVLDGVIVDNAIIVVNNASTSEQTQFSILYNYIGGLVGNAASGSSITHSDFKGSIDVTIAQEDTQTVFIGGLSSSVELADINQSSVEASISFTAPANYQLDNLMVGGAIGNALNATVSNVVVDQSTIDIVADLYNSSVGGLIGTADSVTTLEKSTFKGDITSTTNNVGGLIGAINEMRDAQVGSTPSQIQSITSDTNSVEANIQGMNGVGGLIGTTNMSITIANSWFDGNIHGQRAVGGLVGSIRQFVLTMSSSFSLGTLEGMDALGGLIGHGYSSRLTDCFSRMSITMVPDTQTLPTDTQLYYAGGLVGVDLGTGSAFFNVYFAGTWTNTSGHSVELNPIANFVASFENYDHVYYDLTLFPLETISIGLGKTTGDLKLQTTYSGFNFTQPWFIDPRFNDGYAFFDAGFFRIIVDDGTKPFGYLARYLESIIQPKAPIKTGFVFGGWFSDPQFTHPWNFNSDSVENDVTLLAKWTAQFPDTGETTSFGLGLTGLAAVLLLLSKKSKH